MTLRERLTKWRERLADWISGGALTRARLVQDQALDKYENAANKRLETASKYELAVCQVIELRSGFQAIAAATRDGKSGTARMVHRMATEALK